MDKISQEIIRKLFYNKKEINYNMKKTRSTKIKK